MTRDRGRGQPLVEFDDVAFAYPQPERRREGGFSLAGVSFAIEAGEVFGVIGPNSAGKTTLLRVLTRVVTAGRGEVRLDGRPIRHLAHAELARRSRWCRRTRRGRSRSRSSSSC